MRRIILFATIFSMIPVSQRFHGHGSLRFVFKNGRVKRSRYFTIKAIENKRRHEKRIAVVVSKKIAKHAVDRNRIRRRVYETLRLQLRDIGAVDIVCIITTKDVQTLPQPELEANLRESIDTLEIS